MTRGTDGVFGEGQGTQTTHRLQVDYVPFGLIFDSMRGKEGEAMTAPMPWRSSHDAIGFAPLPAAKA